MLRLLVVDDQPLVSHGAVRVIAGACPKITTPAGRIVRFQQWLFPHFRILKERPFGIQSTAPAELALIFFLGMVGLDADDEKEHRMSNKTRTNNPKKQGMTIRERRAEKRAKAHAERHLFTRRKRADRNKFDISR